MNKPNPVLEAYEPGPVGKAVGAIQTNCVPRPLVNWNYCPCCGKPWRQMEYPWWVGGVVNGTSG